MGTVGGAVYLATVFDPGLGAYRLEVSSTGGITAVEGPQDLPTVRLLSTYPNPANPAVRIRGRVPQAGPVAVEIYDVRGRRVRTLRERAAAAGDVEVFWNGTDAAGHPVPSGTYLLRLRSHGEQSRGRWRWCAEPGRGFPGETAVPRGAAVPRGNRRSPGKSPFPGGIVEARKEESGRPFFGTVQLSTTTVAQRGGPTMTSVASTFVGIDLHQKKAQVCVLTGDGEILAERGFACARKHDGKTLIKYLCGFQADGVRITVEAVGMNRWLVNGCQDEGLSVVVADPHKLDLKMCGNKTDRRDARELARRLLLGDIEKYAKTYYADDDCFGRRQLDQGHSSIKEMRVQVINQIRAMLRPRQEIPPTGSLTTARSMEWLRRLELPTKSETVMLQHYVELLDSLDAHVQALKEEIEEIADEGLAAEWAKLPGLGKLTSAIIYNELGDLTRFKRAKSVASYSGLVPRVNQSGEKVRHGRVTKRGRPLLRWAAGQWAMHALSKLPWLQRWADRYHKRLNKFEIRTMLARKLLVGLYVSYKSGEPFCMYKCVGLEPGCTVAS